MSLHLVVGLSGGLDSTVLLHLMHHMQRKLPQLFKLSAIHV
ncbi:MAG: ATP-binding protein, partial [Burkholderiaceae bacterium]